MHGSCPQVDINPPRAIVSLSLLQWDAVGVHDTPVVRLFVPQSLNDIMNESKRQQS